MNKILKYALIVLGTLVGVAFLYQFRTVVLLLVISLAITATTKPLVEKLNKWKIPKFIGQLMILIILSGAFVGLIIWAGPILLKDFQSLIDFLFTQYRTAYQNWIEGEFWQQVVFSYLPEPWRVTEYLLGSDGELILPAAINLSQSLTNFGSKLFMALIFSLYWAQDEDNFIRVVLSFMPVQKRGRIRKTWKEVEQAIGIFVRQEFLLGWIFALLIGLGYTIFNLPNPLILAFFGFFSWFIPLIGFAAFLVVVYLTTLSLGWGYVAVSVVFAFLIFMGIKYWLEPKLLNSIRYSSFMIVFWIVVLGSFLGFGGFLAGPVVAVALQAIWGEYLYHRAKKYDQKQTDLEISTLKERYANIRNRYAEIQDGYPSQELANIMKRLENSIHQAENVLQGEGHQTG